MNDRLMMYLGAHKDKYPYELEAAFPRILDKIVQLWDSPQITAYFAALMISTRGGREGFAPAIAHELFALSAVHGELNVLREQTPTVFTGKEREDAKRELKRLNLNLVAADMLKAAEYKDPAQILLFLKAGMPVDTRDERDWTPLMVAAFNGNEAVAALLIQHGADPQARDRDGYMPLHWAAFKGYFEVVSLLIDRGVDCNARSNAGWTALLQAAARGHPTVVAMLLEGDADPNIASNEGWTPLHKAVANDYTQTVRILVQAGAAMTAKHQNGSTPLSLAEKSSNTEILDILLRKKL